MADSASGKSSILYDAATIFSLAARAVAQDAQLTQDNRDVLSEAHLTRAIDLLRQAQAAGHFKNIRSVEKAHDDPDLAPLKPREDFKRFLNSLGDAPAEPAIRPL